MPPRINILLLRLRTGPAGRIVHQPYFIFRRANNEVIVAAVEMLNLFAFIVRFTHYICIYTGRMDCVFIDRLCAHAFCLFGILNIVFESPNLNDGLYAHMTWTTTELSDFTKI